MSNALSTIGYESTSIDDFVATLNQAGIKVLLDVRQLPVSRRRGFSKNILKENLENSGIKYVHLSGLGDPKEGRDAARAGRFDDFLYIFNNHMNTDVYKEHLSDAIEIVEQEPTCLMCYERDHQSCHRKLVADEISSILGLKIRHLGVREGIARRGANGRQRKGIGLS